MSGSAESPWRIRAGALAIVLAGAVAYGSSFGGAFVYDDVNNLVDNPHLSSLWPPAGWWWARPGFGLAGRPVTSFTFALNHALSGLDTWSYHAFNLVIHLGTALLLFGLARRALRLTSLTERASGPALAAALLWVVHPGCSWRRPATWLCARSVRRTRARGVRPRWPHACWVPGARRPWWLRRSWCWHSTRC
jgi:hypothetical protein